MDHVPAEEDTVVVAAQAVWRANYGSARQRSGTSRLDTGVPKNLPPAGETEIAWLRQRRDAVAVGSAAAAAARPPRAGPDDEDEEAEDVHWSAGHEQERAFQREKAFKKRMRSLEEGTALPEEVEEFRVLWQEEQEKRRKTDHTRLVGKDRLARLDEGRGCTIEDLQNKAIFVEDECKNDELMDRLKQYGASLSQTRVGATVYVVRDPSLPGNRVKLCACLKGGFVMTPALHQGAVVKFESALQTKRNVYFSAGFCFHHPTLVRIIDEICSSIPTCAWKKIHEEDRYEELKSKAVQRKRALDVLGFSIQEEQQAPRRTNATANASPPFAGALILLLGSNAAE